MKALILAAGYGQRMRPLTDSQHKTLLSIGGRTIIDRILHGLRLHGISDVCIVTGYRADELRSHVVEHHRDIEFTFVHNERFDKTNNIFSMALAFEQMTFDDDLLLIESDLIYDPAVLDRLLKSHWENVALVDRYQPGMDGTVVALTPEKVVLLLGLAGLLLGWAREGYVLRPDIGDGDFALEAAMTHSSKRPNRCCSKPAFTAGSASATATVSSPSPRTPARGYKFDFDFFLMREVESDVHQFHMYAPGDDGPIELVSRIPKQGLEPFEFLGRTWMKPDDHNLNLRYGTWRVPEPDWDTDDDPSVVLRRPWIPPLPSPDGARVREGTV